MLTCDYGFSKRGMRSTWSTPINRRGGKEQNLHYGGSLAIRYEKTKLLIIISCLISKITAIKCPLK